MDATRYFVMSGRDVMRAKPVSEDKPKYVYMPVVLHTKRWMPGRENQPAYFACLSNRRERY
jgi:hypothetical protein